MAIALVVEITQETVLVVVMGLENVLAIIQGHHVHIILAKVK